MKAYSYVILLYLAWSIIQRSDNTESKPKESEQGNLRNKRFQSVLSIGLVFALLLNNPTILPAIESGEILALETPIPSISTLPMPARDVNNIPTATTPPPILSGSPAKEGGSTQFIKSPLKRAAKYLKIKYKKAIRTARKSLIRRIPLRWKLKATKMIFSAAKQAPQYATVVIKTVAKVFGKPTSLILKQSSTKFFKALPWVAKKVLPRVMTKFIPGFNTVSLVLDVYQVGKWIIPKVAPSMFKVLLK
jgi:hypothetical protein